MKFFAIFAAIIALTAGMPAQSQWSLHEINAALANPSTNPSLIPYLEHALNQIVDALHAGLQIDSVAIPLPAEIISPTPAGTPTSEWSLHEITAALANPSTSPSLIPYLEHALNQIMDALNAGLQIDAVAIPLPAEIISPAPVGTPTQSEWSLHEITAALANPSTNPSLIPYLEHALNQIMDALNAGLQIDAVAIPLPAEIISPAPAVVEEEAVAPIESAPAAVPSSPLVQIIVNVNQQSAEAAPSPVLVPSPAVVPEIIPTPVVVVDEVAEPIEPTPVIIVEEVAEEIPASPVDVIEVQPVPVPVEELNPIDVIAVGAPEVNPVDILNPIPVNPAGEVGSIIV